MTVLALAAAGCGGSLDLEALNRSISEGIEKQLSMPVASVQCPPERRAIAAGDAFNCTVTPKAGGRLTVKVTQKDNAGNVAWEVIETQGLLDLDKVESAVREGLKAQAQVDATVDCPDRWRATKVGEVFQCQAATSDGRKATVEVTVTDAEGNINWKVQ
jgi:hypothetical protein